MQAHVPWWQPFLERLGRPVQAHDGRPRRVHMVGPAISCEAPYPEFEDAEIDPAIADLADAPHEHEHGAGAGALAEEALAGRSGGETSSHGQGHHAHVSEEDAGADAAGGSVASSGRAAGRRGHGNARHVQGGDDEEVSDPLVVQGSSGAGGRELLAVHEAHEEQAGLDGSSSGSGSHHRSGSSSRSVIPARPLAGGDSVSSSRLGGAAGKAQGSVAGGDMGSEADPDVGAAGDAEAALIAEGADAGAAELIEPPYVAPMALALDRVSDG